MLFLLNDILIFLRQDSPILTLPPPPFTLSILNNAYLLIVVATPTSAASSCGWPFRTPLAAGSGGGRSGISVLSVGVLWHDSGSYVALHKWENHFLALSSSRR